MHTRATNTIHYTTTHKGNTLCTLGLEARVEAQLEARSVEAHSPSQLEFTVLHQF